MGKSLFCRLCDNSVFRSLPGRSCADKCEEKTDCPKGNVTEKMTTIEKAVKKANTPVDVLVAVIPILEDKNTCYDNDDFVNFCIDLRLAAAYLRFPDGKKPIGKMRELVTKQTNENYKALIHKVVTLTTEYTEEYGRELSGGKRRRRRKSRSKSRKSRRKSRKTKRKRRKSRKTKKRRRRRR